MIKRLLLPVVFILLAALLLLAGAKIPAFAFDNEQEAGLLQTQIRDLHQAFAIQVSDTVFIGDDLTALAPWHDAFPDLAIRNRGLHGDTSASLLQRSHAIIKAKPRRIVIHIGANDAALQTPVDETTANLRELLGLIQSLSPKSDVVLQSALPLQPEHLPAIETINTELQRIAEKREIPYVDLHSELFHANGTLREGLGLSSRHLLSTGYERWAKALTPYLLGDAKLASTR